MTDTSIGEEMAGHSLDIAADNLKKLKGLFPGVFTETKSASGEVVESVDFERLKAEIGTFSDVFEGRKERYGMDWPGKKEAIHSVQMSTYGTLNPSRQESVAFDTTENLFIEGDNLEVLKLLQKSYYGKVKMIYIDPPYNTGSDFIYPDNYAEPIAAYLSYAGLAGESGQRFESLSATSGRFHSKWLTMMFARLALARNLLTENGAIFISIDDGELDNLRKMLSELFGEENFVVQIIWKKRSSPPNDKVIGANHDYIVCYAKNIEALKLNLRDRSEEQISRYKNPDNHPKGPWTSGDLMGNVKGGRYVKSLHYAITNPRTGQSHFPTNNGNWRFAADKVELLIKNNEIFFGDNDQGRPKLKRFLCDVKDGISYPSLWDFVPMNTSGSSEMESIFGNSTVFESPKPVGLMTELIKLGSDPDSIILDFFAGSGSTAHAVIEQNMADHGNRKFIAVQIPEPTGKESEAFKAGFSKISDLTIRRLQNIIERNKQQIGNERQDLGFRVLKLDKSNFKRWQKLGADATVEQISAQLDLHIEHVEHSATPEDLLFEILIKAGFLPTEKYSTVEIAGIPVFSVAEGSLMVCLAPAVTRELIDAVSEAEPMQFVCLDSAFGGNDQLKANASQTFAARNQGRDKARQIIFRTV